MAKMAEFLDKATPERKSITVCPDRGLVGELQAAEQALLEASHGPKMLEDDDKKALREKVEALREKVREASTEFVFVSIGNRAWQELLAEHPPADKDSAEMRDHNRDTFYPAAMSATCESPGMTVDEAESFIAKMPLGVVERAMAAVFDANVEGSPDPFVGDTDGARPTENE